MTGWNPNVPPPAPATSAQVGYAAPDGAVYKGIALANNGSGNTTIGQNLYPKAPDMRLPATQSMTDGELYYTIQNGIRLSGMPAWGKIGENDEDSWKLVVFIRHIPKLTAEEIQHIDEMTPKSPIEL